MSSVALDPSVGSPLCIKLFRNVENATDLRKRAMAGDLQCCLVNPKFIVDPFQLIVAANKALVSDSRRTRTVFTEILFNLSISKNITKSLKQFGVNDGSKDLLAVSVEADSGAAFSVIEGDEVGLEMLEEIRDLDAVRKAYKVKPEEEENTRLLDSVVSRIATRDFISH